MPDRRQFLKSTIATATLGFVARARATEGPSPRLRVAVLFEAGFPAVDAPPVRRDTLGGVLRDLEVTWLGAGDLASLSPDRCDVLLTPYGSAFPNDAWESLLAYLGAGGNWVNLGGTPCAVPVARSGGAGGWHTGPRSYERTHRLGIILACAVRAGDVRAWRSNPALPWTRRLAAPVRATAVWEPYWRLSSVADTPDESGSAGPMEAVVEPLVSGYDTVGEGGGRAIAAPLLLVDRLEREFAGGRWILATSDGALVPGTLRAVLEAAAAGVRRLEVRPSRACYRDGESPAVSVAFRGSRRGAGSEPGAACRIAVFDQRGAARARLDVRLEGGRSAASAGPVDLGAALRGPLAPGLYRVEASLAPAGERSELRAATGFWVWDEALLAGGAPLVAGEDGFTRSGEPYPVTGTTYMASDAHRKFLLQPDPWRWDRDFAEMKRTGVNLVRTGIWTGWKQLMPRPGEFREDALRALDAWLLTARRHDIPVIFTLFAFLPESWGGANAYLDPQAVAAQRAFVTAIAGRYGGMNDLIWDLINEPSFCNPAHLWSCRPNGDPFERAAWDAWIAERHPDGAERAAFAELPALDDFKPGSGKDALVREYRRFAQATFPRWVREMTAALRANGNPRQLVTVGQDEAGTNDSPNNLFFAADEDFTCVHNWWLNDALVWDGVMTKAGGKANLVEETGVMFAGRPAGIEPRWEEYARNLLEKKMAISLAQSAGFVEWVWNSNCYMPSDNEAAIGLLRADGTAKPELEALRGIAAFAAGAARYLVGREREPVLMVVPHGEMFSTQNTATDATQRAVRALVYGCRVGVRAVSEYAPLASQPASRLVVVPSDGPLAPEAEAALASWAGSGTAVVRGGGAPDEARYARALGDAGIRAGFDVAGANASVLVYAAVYRNALLYALAAEGRGGEAAVVRVTSRESGAAFEQRLEPGRSALVLVGRRDGRVLARYPA